ncbi:phage terminase small subunit P27 family, partial [Yersinia enterocolitica]
MAEKKKKTRSPSSSVDPATQYAMDVTAGTILAGPDIRHSCARHLRDLEFGPARGLVWDVESASRAIDFFAKILKLNGGEHEGKPFILLS